MRQRCERAETGRGASRRLLTVAAEAGKASGPVTTLPLSALTPGQGQPRREFDAAKLEQLTASVRERGILQPILVRPVGQQYEIVAGERRWRAATAAGLPEVPVLVREMTSEEARQLALIENLQREDLNAVDEADAKLGLVALTLGLEPEEARTRLMQMLRETPGEDHQKVNALFQTLGESWGYFAKNKLRILNWPPAVLEAVRSGLPFTLAAVVVSAPAEHQKEVLKLAVHGASREELRKRVKSLQTSPAVQHRDGVIRLAKVLSSVRWIERLAPEERDALDGWLEQMPASLRKAIESGREAE